VPHGGQVAAAGCARRSTIKTARACLVSLALGVSGSCFASTVILGGHSQRDCYVLFELAADVQVSNTFGGVSCIDGDPTCDADGVPDGVCEFSIRVCAHVPGVLGCRPRRIGEIRVSDPAIPLPPVPLARERCGDFGLVRVPLRKFSRKPGRAKLRVTAISKVLHPRKDTDRLNLRCVPSPAPCVQANCPKELDVSVANVGSDLDAGWTGAGHNFAWADGWRLPLALSGCNATGYPSCRVDGAERATFGPPLPLLAAGTPSCLVGRFVDGGVTGGANIETGSISLTVQMVADVHLTSAAHVCPRCSGTAVGDAGTCDSGANQGAPCTVEGLATVFGAPAGDDVYPVSGACPPDPGTLAASVAVGFPLFTGISTLPGPSPCSPTDGPPVPDDACGEGTCADGICTDCAGTTPAGECIAPRGGIQQACCSNDTTRPCFPTDPASDGRFERVGFSAQPQPPWPDPSYPKTLAAQLVGTFCLPPTAVGIMALEQGPAAIILPVTEEWRLAPSP